jgi:hypothetical protein
MQRFNRMLLGFAHATFLASFALSLSFIIGPSIAHATCGCSTCGGGGGGGGGGSTTTAYWCKNANCLPSNGCTGGACVPCNNATAGYTSAGNCTTAGKGCGCSGG